MYGSGATRARIALRLVQGIAAGRARGRPFTLSHLITSRCEARCATCLWRGDGRDDLPSGAVIWLYREAAGGGIVHLVVWGGEPLFREDLPRLLGEASSRGLVVTLITNGWFLEERWPELRGTVDALVLSVDDEPAAHDRMRGLPGLSARMEAAVERVNVDARRPRLLVNTVLSRENPGALTRVAPTVRRWGAGWYFCPMETGRMLAAGFDASRAGLALPGRELAQAAAQARDLRRRGYPLLNSPRYLRMLEQGPGLDSYRCRAPRAVLTVEADGAVRDCRRRDAPLANVADLRRVGLPLSHVYCLPRYPSMLEEAGSCTACNNPDVVETSWLWDMSPSMLSRLWRLASG